MVEAHFAQIEKTLLYISEARERAAKSAKELANADAPQHLVAALEEAERALEALGRELFQATYFAVPDEQLAIDTPAGELTVK